MLANFSFDGKEVRSVEIDGEPWFVGTDVAKALGYINLGNALVKHVNQENKQKVGNRFPELGLYSTAVLISEPGLYELCFSSQLPAAAKFQKWIIKEVLASIRKTGSYFLPGVQPDYEEAKRLMAENPFRDYEESWGKLEKELVNKRDSR